MWHSLSFLRECAHLISAIHRASWALANASKHGGPMSSGPDLGLFSHLAAAASVASRFSCAALHSFGVPVSSAIAISVISMYILLEWVSATVPPSIGRVQDSTKGRDDGRDGAHPDRKREHQRLPGNLVVRQLVDAFDDWVRHAEKLLALLDTVEDRLHPGEAQEGGCQDGAAQCLLAQQVVAVLDDMRDDHQDGKGALLLMPRLDLAHTCTIFSAIWARSKRSSSATEVMPLGRLVCLVRQSIRTLLAVTVSKHSSRWVGSGVCLRS